MSCGIQNYVSSRIINSHSFLVGPIYASIIEEDTYKNSTICYGYLYYNTSTLYMKYSSVNLVKYVNASILRSIVSDKSETLIT